MIMTPSLFNCIISYWLIMLFWLSCLKKRKKFLSTALSFCSLPASDTRDRTPHHIWTEWSNTGRRSRDLSWTNTFIHPASGMYFSFLLGLYLSLSTGKLQLVTIVRYFLKTSYPVRDIFLLFSPFGVEWLFLILASKREQFTHTTTSLLAGKHKQRLLKVFELRKELRRP